jgi:hypothetical protein
VNLCCFVSSRPISNVALSELPSPRIRFLMFVPDKLMFLDLTEVCQLPSVGVVSFSCWRCSLEKCTDGFCLADDVVFGSEK